MEEGLLQKEEVLVVSSSSSRRRRGRWEEAWEELKKLGYLAGPMVMVGLTQYLLQMISTMMVGHLGKLALSSSAIATSLTGVAGFSLLLGLASALETLCGQAYGAKQYRKIGTHFQSAIISLSLVCLPLSLILLYIEKILVILGQDPSISLEAGKYAKWLIPSLFAYATLQAQTRYLLSQSLILPLLLSSVAVPLFHAPFCWVLVFKSGLGYIGAAVALSSSLWFNVIILAFYIKYSSSCERTRAPLSKEAFKGIIPFFRLAIPSTLMVCLEWWSFELLVLLSGLLPNPQLETSVLSICLTTIAFISTIPAGFGSAARFALLNTIIHVSSLVFSNELGAGNSEAAHFVVRVIMSVSVTVACIISVSLFASRFVLGYAYSNEKEVIDYVAQMIPLICISIVMDSIQGVLSGIARGCGWQHLGAYVNLGAFYLVGIPVAYLLGFHLHFGGKGLWMGILSGTTVQTVLLSIITKCTNWKQQVLKTRERVFDGRVSEENNVIG